MYRLTGVMLLALFMSAFPTYSWYPITSPTTNNINDIELRSSTYGWLAGLNSSAKFDGSTWTSFPISGSYNMQGISATSDNCAWAVAPSGVMLKFNGTQWQTYGSPTTHDLNDIYLQNNASGWAVGDQVVLHFEGDSWSTILTPAYNLLCLYGNNAGNLWAGGSQGMIFGYNGASWIPHQSPTTANITGIWFTDTDHGWACSDIGEILSWGGSSWSIVPQSNTVPLNSICVPSSTLGFAVGNNGRIVKYNGTSWTIYTNSPTTQNLNAIYMYSTTLGFIGGNAGTLLQYSPVYSVEPTSLGRIKGFYR